MKLSILSLNKPGITDFAKERNELLSKAKTDWVFFLESDEELSPALTEELNSLTSTWKVEQPRHLAKSQQFPNWDH